MNKFTLALFLSLAALPVFADRYGINEAGGGGGGSGFFWFVIMVLIVIALIKLK